MKVNVEAKFTDLDGNEIKHKGDEPLTLGIVASDALTAAFQDEQNLAGEEKVTRFLLATKLRRSKDGLPIEITPEEATLVRKCIGKAYATMIVGQALPMLNGD